MTREEMNMIVAAADELLDNLELLAPDWDAENTVLLRVLVAKLGKQCYLGEIVNEDPAKLIALYPVLKMALGFGYALRKYDERHGLVRETGLPSPHVYGKIAYAA